MMAVETIANHGWDISWLIIGGSVGLVVGIIALASGEANEDGRSGSSRKSRGRK